MEPAALAELHAAAFSSPPPWSAASFAELLRDPRTILLTAPENRAFLLGRIVTDEAEILTLATHPDTRRQGLAHALVERFLDAAKDRGVSRIFLEVAEPNTPARALYASLGFEVVGQRPGYFRTNGAAPVTALVLARRIGDATGPDA
ncbi:GNAT family N-acetyltransferase [Pararhodobacter sp. SW119]|uniref:GNAT family N-acetyltransferase n=1 Tax=Pararhodobacter sp. SW119 TaxID=2780075 RepID=UPI001AE0945F|nr:GNAT family N-acetyltransferase [Pararhodobacter sp. SW119]